MKYGIIFCSYCSNSGKIFTLQKKIIRTSCRSLFQQLQILSDPCHAILSLVTSFIINNQEMFQTNSSIYNINTSRHHHHQPKANPACFQESTFCAGIKIFNSLPPSVTLLKNDKAKFKAALLKYLHTHSFYSVDKFCMCNDL